MPSVVISLNRLIICLENFKMTLIAPHFKNGDGSRPTSCWNTFRNKSVHKMYSKRTFTGSAYALYPCFTARRLYQFLKKEKDFL